MERLREATLSKLLLTSEVEVQGVRGIEVKLEV